MAVSIEDGFETTLLILQTTGKVEAADEAVVVACRALAQALDQDVADAGLWREYRAYLGRLLAGAGGDDGHAALLARLSSAVGNTPKP